MAEKAKYCEHFSVPRSAFADLSGVLASIDFGCSLVKLVFVPKEEVLDDACQELTLHCLTFLPSQFDDVLEVLKSRVHFPKNAPLRVTGVGCVRHEAKIESVLNCKTDFVQEFLAAARGTFFLASKCEHSAVFHATTESVGDDAPVVLPDLAKHFLSVMRTKLTKNNPPPGTPFPAILLLIGSGAAVCYIDAEGCTRMMTGLSVAGRTFLGLSRLLLGTSDYAEIMALAEKGDARSTALLVKHMLIDDPHSPYGLCDPEEPIQPFGHVPNDNKGLDSYSREDLAAGLVHMLCSIFFFFSLSTSEATGVNRYYIGGNWPRSQSVRATWDRSYRTLFPDMLEFSFLRTGHLGAIGAMITDPAESMKYMLM